MSDVDWSQAPDWANYWTIDDIEFAEWHSHKPHMDIHPGSITSPNNWNLSWLNTAKYCYRAPAPRFGWPRFNDRRAKKRLITRPKESRDERAKTGSTHLEGMGRRQDGSGQDA